jgi:hypothetical protein
MSMGDSATTTSDELAGPTRIHPARDLPVLRPKSGGESSLRENTTVNPTMCSSCSGAGWMKEAVPFGHPHFGLLFPCQCKQAV